MNISKLNEYAFRLLFLVFWPLMWYKWMAITDRDIELILFSIYAVITAVFFIIHIVYLRIGKGIYKYKSIYCMLTAVTFIITLLSFMLYQKSLTILYSKLLLIATYYYISYRMVRYRHDDEGVVGLMNALLLFAFTYFY